MSRSTKKPSAASPSVSFKEEVAGRDTLAAIAEAQAEALTPLAHRGPATTKHYGDRISNAPGAVSPKVARALDTAPDISVTTSVVGRETQAALEQDRRTAPPEIEINDARAQETLGDLDLTSVPIEQMHSFVVEARIDQLSSQRAQKHLIDQRLLARMPGCSLNDITDVSVRPWGDGKVLVRVATRVS